ncbi:MAG: ATP-grasp domain-containing protein [Gammaproteobacteria bacterium]|nr:ATP-grasp domain-containing protein [Gammaproteobacteria bacterium]
MESVVSATYIGPNIYSLEPVLRFTLQAVEKVSAAQLATCYHAASEALPALNSIVCETGSPQCFESNPIELAHLLEHISIALQNECGAQLECIRSTSDAAIETNEALVPYEEIEICDAAAKLVCNWLTELAEANTADDPPLVVKYAAEIEDFKKFAARRMLPVQDRAIMRTAREASVPAIRLMGRILQLGQGIYQQRLNATKTTLTNVVSNDVATNKDYSRRIFEELGLPSPKYARVYRSRDAVAAAKHIGFPVVVKPNSGNTGKGISIGLNSSSEVRAAYKLARQYGRSVLIEEFIGGADYRLLVIDGELCAAALRQPAHVIGNGEDSIETLVAKVNSDPQRGIGARFSKTLIALDDRAEKLLKTQGFTRQSVLDKDEYAYLRRNANTSDGGSAIDVTDSVHPHNREIAILATRAMGLDIAGVDLLIPDISQSMLEKNGGAICEVNSRPGLRKHIWPTVGQPRDVTKPIINMLFPSAANCRVPIVVITGNGERNRVANLLINIISQQYKHVGLVSNDRAGIYGSAVQCGPLTLPRASRSLLIDPRLEILIIDASPEDVLAYGLQHDLCDVAIVVENGAPAEVPASSLQAIELIARTTRKHIIVDQTPEYDTSAATLHRIDKVDSTNHDLKLRIKRTVDGTATNVQLGEKPAVNLAIDLRNQLHTGDARYTVHACLAALLLDIEAEKIECALRDGNR